MKNKDLIARAAHFATQAHRRIDRPGRPDGQPFDVHLKAVATLVAEVADDPELIAAAWLHDVVEDTPATFEDVEREFGPGTARLVAELTGVSRPADGAPAARSALDHAHLAQASAGGQTVKLADVIDTCRDLTRHAPAVARARLPELAALLEVLTAGHPVLRERARKTLLKSAERLNVQLAPGSPGDARAHPAPMARLIAHHRAERLFIDAFHASDLAEPLRSVDAATPASEAAALLARLGLTGLGVRREGRVEGFVRACDLSSGSCGDAARPIHAARVVDSDAPLPAVIDVLTRHEHCLVAFLGEATGVATRADMQKPVLRMWLFGMITLTEMELAERIGERWPDESWSGQLSSVRLDKARALHAERLRRDQPCSLLDCLQLGDKAEIVMNEPRELAAFGFDSRKAAQRVVGELESLRNNLAHAQDIVTHDWPQIIRLAQRVGEWAR